jgi:hypothetical protein
MVLRRSFGNFNSSMRSTICRNGKQRSQCKAHVRLSTRKIKHDGTGTRAHRYLWRRHHGCCISVLPQPERCQCNAHRTLRHCLPCQWESRYIFKREGRRRREREKDEEEGEEQKELELDPAKAVSLPGTGAREDPPTPSTSSHSNSMKSSPPPSSLPPIVPFLPYR